VSHVFAHDHFGVNSTERLAHNADLLRGDVVNVHEDALAVLLDGFLYVGPDLFLGGFLVEGHIETI